MALQGELKEGVEGSFLLGCLQPFVCLSVTVLRERGIQSEASPGERLSASLTSVKFNGSEVEYLRLQRRLI